MPASCHITVNGIPHCVAPVYALMKARNLSSQQMIEATCACGYGDKRAKAEADADRLKKALPDTDIKVADGECSDDPYWDTAEGIATMEMEYARYTDERGE